MPNTGIAMLNRNENENAMEKRIKKRVPGLSLSKVIKTRKALRRYFNSKNGYKNFRKAGLPEEVSEQTAYSILYGNNNSENNMSSKVPAASMNQPVPMNKQMNQAEPMAPMVIPNSMANNPTVNTPRVNNASVNSSHNNFMKKYGKTAKAPVKQPWFVANRGGRRTRSKKTKSKSRR